MNRLIITGNATKDAELRTTPQGKNVCTFTIAVNRRKKVEGQPEADFFRVSAWDALGEICAKYIQKGKKVAVVGAVSVHAYSTQDGKPGATLDVIASEVEFLSGRSDSENGTNSGDTDGLPLRK